MELRITTLIENNPDDKGRLFHEHGLSLFVEVGELKILFDTGKSGKFTQNAQVLNKNLNKLDYCVLSHGHYDHSGGVVTLLKSISNYPQFVIGEDFFNEKYKTMENPEYVYNGNPFEEEFLLKRGIEVIKVSESMKYLSDRVVIFHHFSSFTEYEKRNNRFYIKKEEDFIPDDFDDEIAMGVLTSKGLVLIVGCSHVGIINMLKTVNEHLHMPIYAIVGGTHLIEADAERLNETVNELKQMNITQIAVSHCTGEEGIQRLQQEFPLEFLYNNTGNVIEI